MEAAAALGPGPGVGAGTGAGVGVGVGAGDLGGGTYLVDGLGAGPITEESPDLAIVEGSAGLPALPCFVRRS